MDSEILEEYGVTQNGILAQLFSSFTELRERQHLYALLLSVRTHIKPLRVTEYYHISLVILLTKLQQEQCKQEE